MEKRQKKLVLSILFGVTIVIAMIIVLFYVSVENDRREWDDLSARIEAYVSKNGGFLVRTTDLSREHRWKRWVIAIPTDTIAEERRFELSEELVAAVSTGHDGMSWEMGGHDPRVYKRSDGCISTAYGPSPVRESHMSGKGVSVRLTTSGLAKSTLGAYDRIAQESAPPATELIIELDLMVIR